jgi:glycosyltransferase involved in cell wall biosynthesis
VSPSVLPDACPPRLLLFDAYPLAGGGSIRVLARLGRSLRTRGWDVSAMLPAPGPVPDWLREQGFRVDVLDAPSGLMTYAGQTSPVAALALLPGYWRRVRSFLRAHDVDVVWVTDLRGLLLVAPAVRLSRASLVWHVQSDPPNWNGLARPLSKLAHAVVAPSKALAAGQGLGAHVTVLANAVDERPDRIDPVSPLVVTCSRLYPVKGLDVLIAAVALLRDKGIGLSLRVLGAEQPGFVAYAEELHEQVRSLELEGLVELMGHVEDVDAELKQAQIYAQPSREESSGLSVLEAMAWGVPVIVTDVGGLPEVVADGAAGLMVKPEDPVALATALERLLTDAGLRPRRGAVGRQRSRTVFSPQAFEDGVLAIADPMLRRSRRRGPATR